MSLGNEEILNSIRELYGEVNKLTQPERSLGMELMELTAILQRLGFKSEDYLAGPFLAVVFMTRASIKRLRAGGELEAADGFKRKMVSMFDRFLKDI